MHTSAAAGGPEPGASDADPMRMLILAVLDRIERFAVTVIDDRPRDGRTGPTDAAGRPIDLGPALRAALDALIVEVSEVVNRFLAAVIAVLEAVSSALDDVIAHRARTSTGRNPSSRPGSFQPIVVEVETDEGPW